MHSKEFRGQAILPWFERKSVDNPVLANNIKSAIKVCPSLKVLIAPNLFAHCELVIRDGIATVVDYFDENAFLPYKITQDALSQIVIVDTPLNIVVINNTIKYSKDGPSKISNEIIRCDKFVSRILKTVRRPKVILLDDLTKTESSCSESFIRIAGGPYLLPESLSDPKLRRTISHELTHFYVEETSAIRHSSREMHNFRSKVLENYGSEENRLLDIYQDELLKQGGLEKWQDINGQGIACLVDSIALKKKEKELMEESVRAIKSNQSDINSFRWDNAPSQIKFYFRNSYIIASSFFYHLNLDYKVQLSDIASSIRNASREGHDMKYICQTIGIDYEEASTSWIKKLKKLSD